jgi:hypothetical protein
VRDDILIDSETLLMTDFVNLKIKPAQSFKIDHRGRVCVHVFIGVSAHMCISTHPLYCVSKKRILEILNMLKLCHIILVKVCSQKKKVSIT